ncbi:MAG: UMP kinase [Candidatus Cloacimonetes bacterium]|nr:UMP kinase [Candidatus Cloacimonadota bacterium]MCF7813068.1 UMP kinase [Candidatus Cloacimonadota bacterium]MCF7867191.1 UMP kinase [Candidatus Cloacimonadota bacterium]MCF7882635.1 UMP kinase [Candidatus Cloacimonadota bacterium]
MHTYKPEKIHTLILKLSGEVLAGNKGFGFDMDRINELIDEVITIRKMGYRIGIVLGGGNFFRGASEMGGKLNRVTADNVGMLATVQNALVFSNMMKNRNYQTEVYSAFQVERIAKFYTPNRAITSLNEGKICFFCGGIANPFFTTDTTAILRAVELKADIVFKATKVDGVYTADPVKNKDAKFLKDVTFDEVLDKKLKIMDMTAFSLAREYNMPIKVFNIGIRGNLKDAVSSKNIGTFVHS